MYFIFFLRINYYLHLLVFQDSHIITEIIFFLSLSCTHALSRSPFQATLLHLRRFEGVGGSQGFFARCSFPTTECGIARTLQGTLCQLSLKACRGVGEDLHTAQAGPDLNTPLC